MGYPLLPNYQFNIYIYSKNNKKKNQVLWKNYQPKQIIVVFCRAQRFTSKQRMILLLIQIEIQMSTKNDNRYLAVVLRIEAT